MRILITGSRDWLAPNTVQAALLTATQGVDDDDITIVSGGCPAGADAQAEHIAARMGWKVERHEADWETHGRRAGYLRNKAMVDAGADVCLAFIRNGSRGASMTAELAEQAGIPVTMNRQQL